MTESRSIYILLNHISNVPAMCNLNVCSILRTSLQHILGGSQTDIKELTLIFQNFGETPSSLIIIRCAILRSSFLTPFPDQEHKPLPLLSGITNTIESLIHTITITAKPNPTQMLPQKRLSYFRHHMIIASEPQTQSKSSQTYYTYASTPSASMPNSLF